MESRENRGLRVLRTVSDPLTTIVSLGINASRIIINDQTMISRHATSVHLAKPEVTVFRCNHRSFEKRVKRFGKRKETISVLFFQIPFSI
jgi:hypothetical protein